MAAVLIFRPASLAWQRLLHLVCILLGVISLTVNRGQDTWKVNTSLLLEGSFMEKHCKGCSLDLGQFWKMAVFEG